MTDEDGFATISSQTSRHQRATLRGWSCALARTNYQEKLELASNSTGRDSPLLPLRAFNKYDNESIHLRPARGNAGACKLEE